MSSNAIYIRTSTKIQNPENQLGDIMKMFQGEYKIYKDNESAYKENVNREFFNNLIADIKKGEVKDIYVWDFDRVYRNRVKFKEFLELIGAYKCKLHSYNQQWMESINKIPNPWNEIVYDMLIQIFGYIAEEESKLKSKRIKNAIVIKKDGVYSYKGNKWGRDRISTFKKNRMLQLYNEGMSMRKISKELKLSIGVVHKYISEFKQQNN